MSTLESGPEMANPRQFRDFSAKFADLHRAVTFNQTPTVESAPAQHENTKLPRVERSLIKTLLTSYGESNFRPEFNTQYGMQIENMHEDVKAMEALLAHQAKTRLVAHVSVREGLYVIVRCGGVFCRAIVIKVVSADCARCLCIDYGNYVWINPTCTYRLESFEAQLKPWMSLQMVIDSEAAKNSLKPGNRYTLKLLSLDEDKDGVPVYVVNVFCERNPILKTPTEPDTTDSNGGTAMIKTAADFLLAQQQSGIYSLAHVVEILMNPRGELLVLIELDDSESSTRHPALEPPSDLVTVRPVNNAFLNLQSGQIVLVLVFGERQADDVLPVLMENMF